MGYKQPLYRRSKVKQFHKKIKKTIDQNHLVQNKYKHI